MKKKRRMLSVSISMLVLSAMMFLSACGKEEEPAEEETLRSKLERLAVETIIENSEMNGPSLREGEIEAVIDKICFGSFSNEASLHLENANEIFVECRLLHMSHAGGLDTRAGILLDADTFEMIAYKEFAGDDVTLNCLQTNSGQQRIVCSSAGTNQGFRVASIEIYAVQGNEWVEISTQDITELLPVNEKYDYGAFSYYMMGERLVVTWESFPKMKAEQILNPAELIAILVWDPNQEQFVIAPNTEQPAIRQEPAEEETMLSKLERLAVETIIENSEMNGPSLREGEIEAVIDKICFGSFSNEASLHLENANEMFVECRLLHMSHAGGFDTRAGILLDADTFEMIAYKEFAGDEVLLNCLQTANGQSRILFLGTSAGTGSRAQAFELWGIRDGEWEELPTGIEEFIPEEHKEIVTGGNGTEIWTGDSFCYVAGGGRLVVTYEEDDMGGARVPSELSVILEWNPFQERFELTEDNTEQPAIRLD